MAAITYLDTLVGNRFDSTLQAAAIALAVAYTGVADSTSARKDMGLALLAVQALKTRELSSEDSFPTDFGVLMTSEIQDLLFDTTAEDGSVLATMIQYKPMSALSSNPSGFV